MKLPVVAAVIMPGVGLDAESDVDMSMEVVTGGFSPISQYVVIFPLPCRWEYKFQISPVYFGQVIDRVQISMMFYIIPEWFWLDIL